MKDCDLCGVSVGRHPFRRRFEEEEREFCCLGCLNVYTILLESGVIKAGQDARETALYRQSLALGLISNGDERAKSPASLPQIPADAPTRESLLQVSGMWCSSCAWLIERVLKEEPGVASAEVFFASDLVKIKYFPQYLPPDRIAERLGQLGYQAGEYTGENEAALAEKRDLLLRLGVAGFLYLNIMTLSMALYVGYFEQIAESVRRFLPFVLMGLATPIVFYSATPIMKLMWQGFLYRVVRMETLLGIGILAAYVYSAVQAFRGESHVYFDTASAIVTLVLLGKLIERNAKEQTAQAITLLYRMTPKKARLLSGGHERFVSIEAVGVGDVFIVKSGERIPADGVVIEGSSHVDESLLTGESTPIEKEPGDAVAAGSLNAGHVLRVRAVKVGPETTLAQIIKLVERAMSGKSKIERTVDRISRIFVPSVIAIAILTFTFSWLGGFAQLDDALMRAITVLVIACPCALGMATPLAVTAAIGSASRRGILVSDSRVLETIRRVDTVIFDKTGVITEGNFALLDIERCLVDEAQPVSSPASFSNLFWPERQQSNDHLDLSLIASLERFSEHPLGRSVIRRAEAEAVKLSEAREVEILKGQGIAGLVGSHRVFIGNRKLVEGRRITIPPQLEKRAKEWECTGRTVAFYGWDNRLRGLLSFGDRIKPSAAKAVTALKQRGIETIIVSGDALETTAWASAAVGADDFISDALPLDKIKVVEKLQRDGLVVAMIGDGVNDAPALSQADLGVAVGSGAEIAMKAAAIVLMSNSLNQLPEIFNLAGKTGRIVRQNLFWAFFYNSVGVSLAVVGILNPIVAAGAMLLSSLSVIGNSLRLTKFASSSSVLI